MNQLIIFSKNRACQLDLLIRSIKKNTTNLFNKITVIYTHDENHYFGYKKLISLYDIEFIKEKNFRNDLLNSISENFNFTTFLVDDIVFYKNTDIDHNDLYNLIDNQTICFSLRLGLNCYYSHPANLYYSITEYNDMEKYIEFDHTKQLPGDFSYPLSTDGHIYDTLLIKKILSSIDFLNPNTMEINMQRYKLVIPNKIKCFKHSVIVSSPVNIVNTSIKNKNGIFHFYDSMFLENKFIENYIINIDCLNFENINGPHKELEYIFTKE